MANNHLTVFPLLQKSCWSRSMYFIFTGLTFFVLGNHLQVFAVHAGFIRPSVIDALTRNKDKADAVY